MKPLFLAGALLVLILTDQRATAGRATRTICFFLKLLGLCVMAVCLLDPLWSGQRARPGANLFVVMADNSQGMQIKDRDETRSRGELLRDLVSMGKSDWLAKLDANFQLRRYLFDARLQSTRDFSELALDARSITIVMT